ncbi:MAG TPA: 2Fe-2S iron-sulfur cluster binding domain-containing protein [Chloroflexi bacterium]|nr:2Fe-2S iron-sulfur cluster binding domain-containing protein [Chloroflexota bacterium]
MGDYEMKNLTFVVNEKEHTLEINPDEMLSDVLRYRLGLTGTKVSCGEAECGACTVLVDGDPILSCNYPAVKARGKHITTIEGLSEGEELHPLQEAFIKHGAVQCGFCTPGQIVTAAALLNEKPDPTDEDIEYALNDTLCRCGTYPMIINAIHAAADKINQGKLIEYPSFDFGGGHDVVGQVVPRPEAKEKVTGEAIYTDDISFPDMLYGATLRAGVPHGRVKTLDISKARELPGVQAVLTAEDIPGRLNHGLIIQDWPALVGVGQKVRYVGDAIAIVAADTQDIARQALDLIEVDIEPLPAVTDPVDAYKEDAPLVHESGNLLKHIKVNKGDIQKGFQEAEVVFEDTFYTPTYEHAFMEPECSIARVLEDGKVEVYVGSQIPYSDRDQVAEALGVPYHKVRVKGPLVGGGFGGKEDIVGQIHAALLANATGKPVKILYDRHESLLVHPKRHATQITVKLGLKKDGTLTAAQTELYGDTGAYASLGAKVMGRATTHSTGPYVVPNVKIDCYAMYTNNPPAGAFRGFGAFQAAFAIENMMDRVAEALDIDPIELRRKNALREGSITNTGQVLHDSVGLVECIDKTAQAVMKITAGEDPFLSRAVPGEPNKRRAWGFSVTFKNTGLGEGAPDNASAEIEILVDGRVETRISSAEIGQGLVTVLQQITAEELKLPLEQVNIYLSDTDLTPDGGPTTGSRQTYISGNAAKFAAITLRNKILSTLSEKYNLPPDEIILDKGLVHVNGRKLTFAEVRSLMKEEGHEPKLLYEYKSPETTPLGEPGDKHFAYSFAAQAVEVEVDLVTGEVRVVRAVGTTDVGKAINPLGLQGQTEGGLIMGIGHALTEEFIVEDGQVFTDYLSRYRMPSIHHVPDEIQVMIVEDPTSDGPYGGKGVGEISTMPVPPAIVNAIYNACGVRMNRIPVDQDWLAGEIAKEGR